jgi:hypothetical protein
MSMTIIPLAYKYVAIAAMLGEINLCADRLQLSVGRPISPDSLRLIHVTNPFTTGFGGTLETSDFSFVFFKSGVLRRIVRLNRFASIPLRELQWQQSRMTSLVSSNQAYQLATNWLAAIDVDVGALEEKHSHFTEQKFFFPDSSSITNTSGKERPVILLPIFVVNWGTHGSPVVRVSIFGPSKELLSIHQEDDSFSRRPRKLLKEEDALLAVSDRDFLRYSEKELRQLRTYFAVNPPVCSVPLQILTERGSQPHNSRVAPNSPETGR